ncbi:hypothetical protein BRC86_10855 [Halobacteriales archaeon QS_3_64_16]|nr:MAG: hypothetical protein BRC86_10855 [Halobacteriales archaeon QS_3_64_16]
MGTGAVEQMDSGDRQVVLATAQDNNAYYELVPSRYSEIDGDGKLAIVLDRLNPSSTSTLDDVYRIRNSRDQSMDVWVTDDTDAITHRRTNDNSSIEESGNSVSVGSGSELTVAVTVDASALNLNSDGSNTSGNFAVHYQE